MFTIICLVFPFCVSGCSIWRAHANLAALGLSKLHQQLACSSFEKSTWPCMAWCLLFLVQKMDLGRSWSLRSRFYDFPGELTAEVVDSALDVLGNLVQTFTGASKMTISPAQ